MKKELRVNHLNRKTYSLLNICIRKQKDQMIILNWIIDSLLVLYTGTQEHLYKNSWSFTDDKTPGL